jgi:uncharacterized protein
VIGSVGVSWENLRGTDSRIRDVPRGNLLTKGIRMETTDLDLIEQWKDRDPELRRLWEEHLEFEEQLAAFNKRVYLSPTEELERKTLQKKKLKGRDLLERILIKLRRTS